eukprot:gb/GEZJ01002355.1/.p1 GENE.gb/GEZJ01002355.1/~~gb/GEZJ01002355.1/.p1  ORF type:complete len:400 (+),score=35.17 gb/GEZJ01002355.1/:1-1200(+)
MRVSQRLRNERRDLMALLHDREDIVAISLDSHRTHRHPAYNLFLSNPEEIVRLYREELVKIVGKQIVLFLEATPDYVLSDIMLRELGLTESVHDSNNYSSQRSGADWNITTIYWDNTHFGFVGIDQATDDHYSILLYTLFFEGAEEGSPHRVESKQGRFVHGSQSRELAILQIHTWCMKTGNQGRHLLMAHSRSRRKSSITPRYRELSYRCVPFQDRFDLCIQAAICNGLDLLGSNDSEKYWKYFCRIARFFETENELPPRIRDFRDAQKHLQQWNVTLRHVTRGNCPSVRDVLALPSGVYVLTIDGTNGVIHSLVIDTGRRIILDCVEEFPLTLCERALEGCVDDTSTFTGIREVRMVHVPDTEGRSKKPRHRNGTNNKKKRRKLAIERERAKETRAA